MVSAAFVLLALHARPDILDNVRVHLWLPKVAVDELQGFILAKMSGHLGVMLGFQDRSNQVLWDPKPSLSVEDSIDLGEDAIGFAV